MFLQRKVVGDSPLYVRRVGERHKIVRQTDSGFGVDAQAGPGGPLSPDRPCSSGLLHVTLSWVGSPVLAAGPFPPVSHLATASLFFMFVSLFLFCR